MYARTSLFHKEGLMREENYTRVAGHERSDCPFPERVAGHERSDCPFPEESLHNTEEKEEISS